MRSAIPKRAAAGRGPGPGPGPGISGFKDSGEIHPNRYGQFLPASPSLFYFAPDNAYNFHFNREVRVRVVTKELKVVGTALNDGSADAGEV